MSLETYAQGELTDWSIEKREEIDKRADLINESHMKTAAESIRSGIRYQGAGIVRCCGYDCISISHDRIARVYAVRKDAVSPEELDSKTPSEIEKMILSKSLSYKTGSYHPKEDEKTVKCIPR